MFIETFDLNPKTHP